MSHNNFPLEADEWFAPLSDLSAGGDFDFDLGFSAGGARKGKRSPCKAGKTRRRISNGKSRCMNKRSSKRLSAGGKKKKKGVQKRLTRCMKLIEDKKIKKRVTRCMKRKSSPKKKKSSPKKPRTSRNGLRKPRKSKAAIRIDRFDMM